MNIIDIIEKKKKGLTLSGEEIRYFIDGMMDGTIKDYQTSSLLMAICLRGMDARETSDLTMAMRDSGDVLDLKEIGKKVVDKHSTGGVGDKTTLVVGPIMASLGVPVAKMSGRGLGITGGTIDKLDSIPGFSSDVSDEDFIRQVKEIGIVDAAQNKNLAPADKSLYALRDVTGTVDSIPLIASSIMSKKLASGADGIVLDVKCGSGAFMSDLESASVLSNTMIDIAKLCGKECIAVISDMNQPLGYTVGNLLEVMEVVLFLNGKKKDPRFERLVIEICRNMYLLSGEYIKLYGENLQFRKDDETYREFLNDKIITMIRGSIESGLAYIKFKEFISYQGGDAGYLDFLEEPFCSDNSLSLGDIDGVKKIFSDEVKKLILAPRSGFISRIDAELIGRASLELGAGRITKDSEIDLKAGIIFEKTVGDKVAEGDVIAALYSSEEKKTESAAEIVNEALNIGDDSVIIKDVVIKRMQ